MRRSTVACVLAAIVIMGMHAGAARADWLQPDPSYREAQLMLRMAARDTLGHADDPGRLDSLGVALLRLARLDDAARIFERSLAVSPADAAARAALGKIALFRNRLGEAESLLAGVTDPDAMVGADLYAVRMRRGDYAGAAAVAASAGEESRAPLLARMAEQPIYRMTPGRDHASVMWSRTYPVPLVRVKLNGLSVLMALDTGASDVLIDESYARRCKVQFLAGQRLEFWCGSRLAVKNAMVQKIEIGGIPVENIPAGALSLRRWTLEVNPQSEPVAGIIGLGFLERFTPTLDYKNSRLELAPRRDSAVAVPGAMSVPFEIWGASELMVYGTLAGSRRMAFVIQTGVPGCGVGAPSEVFDEVGVKPSVISKIVKGAGSWLQGRPWTAATVPGVAVGPVVKDKVPGWVGALDASELWRHGVRRDALLSSDFFRGRKVTIDWEQQRLLFEE
jgi:hypothetical protein